MTIPIRRLTRKGAQDYLAQLAADRKLIESAIGFAQTRAATAEAEVQGLGRALSSTDSLIIECRARLADLDLLDQAEAKQE